MPSIYQLKPAFQGILRPAVSKLAQAGIKANHVTVFTCAASVSIGWLLTTQIENHAILLLLAPFLLLRMAMNAIDGMLAIEFGQKSDLGAYLNELTDVVSDACLYAPFAWLPAFDPFWIVAIIILAIVSEMAGVIGSRRTYDGPMGKSDRAFVFGAMAVWVGFGWNINPWASWLFTRLIALLLVVTIVNRIRSGLTRNANSGRTLFRDQ